MHSFTKFRSYRTSLFSSNFMDYKQDIRTLIFYVPCLLSVWIGCGVIYFRNPCYCSLDAVRSIDGLYARGLASFICAHLQTNQQMAFYPLLFHISHLLKCLLRKVPFDLLNMNCIIAQNIGPSLSKLYTKVSIEISRICAHVLYLGFHWYPIDWSIYVDTSTVWHC